MKPQCFKQMLYELDCADAAGNSVINHHTEGMDYLCLHRSSGLTVKLYLIDPARVGKSPGSYLVTPHTHRYSFGTTVLGGRIQHLVFSQAAGDGYDRFGYAPENRERRYAGEIGLAVQSDVMCTPGVDYWVSIFDIHTLVVPTCPVLLGLVQLGDIVPTSTVYLAKGDEMLFPKPRVPTGREARDLRDRALDMMEAQ
jgi:hypothetical protein